MKIAEKYVNKEGKYFRSEAVSGIAPIKSVFSTRMYDFY
jgi:hypothetical protein